MLNYLDFHQVTRLRFWTTTGIGLVLATMILGCGSRSAFPTQWDSQPIFATVEVSTESIVVQPASPIDTPPIGQAANQKMQNPTVPLRTYNTSSSPIPSVDVQPMFAEDVMNNRMQVPPVDMEALRRLESINAALSRDHIANPDLDHYSMPRADLTPLTLPPIHYQQPLSANPTGSHNVWSQSRSLPSHHASNYTTPRLP